jgi:hypothetical protein
MYSGISFERIGNELNTILCLAGIILTIVHSMALGYSAMIIIIGENYGHRLNMELDLQSLFGLRVYGCNHWLRPQTSPPPAFEITRSKLNFKIF